MVLINIMSHDVPCLLFLLVDCWRHMLCRSWIRGKFECFTKFGKHFGFPQYTLWLWRGRVVNFSGKLSLSIFSNIQSLFLNFSSQFLVSTKVKSELHPTKAPFSCFQCRKSFFPLKMCPLSFFQALYLILSTDQKITQHKINTNVSGASARFSNCAFMQITLSKSVSPNQVRTRR